MKIAVLCPSDIAFRRFMPSLTLIDELQFAGVGVVSPEERYGASMPNKDIIENMLRLQMERARDFTSLYGGEIYKSYNSVISSYDVDAVYIPLPPALHYKWAIKALEHGKHVLLEKPATISFIDTSTLIDYAKYYNLALHENYMFIYHKQIDAIDTIIRSGEIGDVRLYRISFGFPRRSKSDFRYNNVLGGGALFDAGGYTIKYAYKLLGETTNIQFAKLNYTDEFDVDLFGSAELVNEEGITAQIAFGMDNDYKCELEVWGSKGTLKTGRVLTAPAGFAPTMTIKKNTEIEERPLPADDAFKKSIKYFMKCVTDKETREENYKAIMKQAQLVEQFSEMAKR